MGGGSLQLDTSLFTSTAKIEPVSSFAVTTLKVCSGHDWRTLSSPEAAILSASTKNNDLWPVPKYAQSLWRSILVTDDSYQLFKISEIAQKNRKSLIPGLYWFGTSQR